MVEVVYEDMISIHGQESVELVTGSRQDPTEKVPDQQGSLIVHY